MRYLSELYAEDVGTIFLRNVNPTHWTTWCHNQGDHNINFHGSETPSSYTVSLYTLDMSSIASVLY
jgi:hypothetical protein